jgi:hypothetical protein
MLGQIVGKNTVTFSNSNAKDGLSTGIPYYISAADNMRLDEAKAIALHPSKDLVKIMEQITKYYLVKSQSNVSGVQMKSVQVKSTNSSNSSGKPKIKAPSNKTLEPIFKILHSDKNRPHCISRALKLLDMASITGKFPSRVGVSKVCSPDTDKNLSSYAHTKSVGQLYGKIDPTDYQKSMNILIDICEDKSLAFEIYKKNSIYSVPYIESKYANNIKEFNRKVSINVEKAKALL